MVWTRSATVFIVALAVLATAAAPAVAQRGPETAVARMVTAEGAAAGRVEFVTVDELLAGGGESDGGGAVALPPPAGLTGRALERIEGLVAVLAQLRGLPPGFHGFHVHETGRCDAPSFATAGGHFNPSGASHPNHAGDMPLLHVNGDGTAVAGFFTDRFRLPQLFDADGSAIIVHAAPDNYANIPRDRYDPDPDATTLATGDAGVRIACAVVSRGQPTDFAGDAPPRAAAQIRRSDGVVVGDAEFGPFQGKVFGVAFLNLLAPGFHGLHVHDTGRCDRPGFESAGGHLNPTGAAHGAHAGDLPLAYVTRARVGIAAFTTDRFRIRDLVTGDRTAIVVHAGPDNYANIPADRYDPDPDATTLATGDAGARIACGVIRRLVRCTIDVRPSRLRAGDRTRLRVRVRSDGLPVRDGLVLVSGPGFGYAAPTNARGEARLAIRPTRPGRLRVSVLEGTETLGCATTRPIVGGAFASLTGRSPL